MIVVIRRFWCARTITGAITGAISRTIAGARRLVVFGHRFPDAEKVGGNSEKGADDGTNRTAEMHSEPGADGNNRPAHSCGVESGCSPIHNLFHPTSLNVRYLGRGS